MRQFEGYRRGVNLGGWLSQCVGTDDKDFRTFITEEDIRKIASWGLDHVRLPVDCDIVFSGPSGEPGPRMRWIDECIGWCEKNGLNLILDLHKTFGFMFDPHVVSDPAAFFRDEGLQAAFLSLWRTLARRYGKMHGHVAFELLNEVTNTEFALPWNGIARRAIAAIRETAPQTYILVGGVHNNSVGGVLRLDPPADKRIVYNFHCYDPLLFTHRRAPWIDQMPRDLTLHYPDTYGAYRAAAQKAGMRFRKDEEAADEKMLSAGDFEGMFRPAVEYAEKYDVPLYCGEYGVIDRAAPEDTLNWFRDIHAAFEKYGIGRAAWTYRQRDFGIDGSHYDGIREELIRCL